MSREPYTAVRQYRDIELIASGIEKSFCRIDNGLPSPSGSPRQTLGRQLETSCSHIFSQVNQAAGIAPFIVVPGNHFGHITTGYHRVRSFDYR